MLLSYLFVTLTRYHLFVSYIASFRFVPFNSILSVMIPINDTQTFTHNRLVNHDL